MGPQHPDDRFMLTGAERSQFRQIWKELADENAGTPGPGTDRAETDSSAWAVAVIACVVLVFVGLAANSVLLVLAATGGAMGARFALRG